ncbi:MAG: PadR family transcriptional regulator [Corynebacteriales bacterium]|nr:PadR family transcriptional regulator [Mycobacteriales bacterium]
MTTDHVASTHPGGAPTATAVDRAMTPLAVLVLGLAAERPMHPYEMLQTLLARKEDRFANIRPGSLYHTVDRLLARELLCVSDIERSGNRPERTVYAITDHGRAALAHRLTVLLQTPSAEYPELYLGLAEAHELPAATVIESLAVRIDVLTAERALFTVAAEQATGRGVSEIYLLDIGCRCATLTAQIDWLTDLHARLVVGTLPWDAVRGCRGGGPPLTSDDFATDPTTREESPR